MGTEFDDWILYIGAFVFVIALIVIGAWLLKGMTSGSGPVRGGILRGRERRLGVVEAASVDGRRKLVLVRRDDVEHLIMTGGPVDVLIETGIERSRPFEQTYDPLRDDGGVTIARDDDRPKPANDDLG
ncbi:MAG: hypothetical protein ACR2PO_08385 [Methyloligellaceae bacterium]